MNCCCGSWFFWVDCCCGRDGGCGFKDDEGECIGGGGCVVDGFGDARLGVI